MPQQPATSAAWRQQQAGPLAGGLHLLSWPQGGAVRCTVGQLSSSSGSRVHGAPAGRQGWRLTRRAAQVGNVVEGVIKAVKPFGVFVDIGLAQHALLHAAQVSADRISDIGAIFKEGDAVKVRASARAARRALAWPRQVLVARARRPPPLSGWPAAAGGAAASAAGALAGSLTRAWACAGHDPAV